MHPEMMEPTDLTQRRLASLERQHDQLTSELARAQEVSCQRDKRAQVAEAEREEFRAKLWRIEQLARQHNHPGVNVGAHDLANKIVKIIEQS